jgi:putative phage-type endonuclease
MNQNTERVLQIKTVEQRTPEWFTMRDNMLTASDVASAIGKNPYKSKKALIKDKCGQSKKFVGNFMTEWGCKYEPEAIRVYERDYNNKVYETGLYQHNVHTFLGASPDGITYDGKLVEVKAPYKRKIEHKIPDHYYPQVQLQLEVLDIETCLFIQYKPATEDDVMILDVLEIDRDKTWFEENFDKMEMFWNEVLQGRKDIADGTKEKKQIDLSAYFSVGKPCLFD